MSANLSGRTRTSLAAGAAVALAAASLTIGVSPASALSYATVTAHDTTDSNTAAGWCPGDTAAFKAEDDGGEHPFSDFGTMADDGRTFVLGADADPEADGIQPYVKVVVKAGAGPSTEVVNTVFAAPPVAGQTVWADSDGSSLNTNEGPTSGDKAISHIIICAGTTPAPLAPGNVSAVKQWTYTGADPSSAADFVAGTPGTLTFNEIQKPWTNNVSTYAAGTDVTVVEGVDGTPPTAANYECTVMTGATTYTVGDTTTTTTPTVNVASETTVEVTITNTADCASVTPPVITPPVITPPVVTPPVITPPVVTPPVVTPPVVTPPVVTPPVITPGVVTPQVVTPAVVTPLVDVEDTAVVGSEELAVVEAASTVAGSEDELADTGANLTGGLGAILVLAGAALIAARRSATQ